MTFSPTKKRKNGKMHLLRPTKRPWLLLLARKRLPLLKQPPPGGPRVVVEPKWLGHELHGILFLCVFLVVCQDFVERRGEQERAERELRKEIHHGS